MIVDKANRLTSHSFNSKRYHVSIDRYPTLRSFLWAEIYHKYDMVIPVRIPGWGRFERWLRDHGAEHRFAVDDPPKRVRDRLFGWSVEQDLRCYELHARAETLAVIELDEETWAQLSTKDR